MSQEIGSAGPPLDLVHGFLSEILDRWVSGSVCTPIKQSALSSQ